MLAPRSFYNNRVFPNLNPMPLVRRPEPFSHPDWLFEIKHDGFRALAFIQDGSCRLVSRNGNAFKTFDAICQSLPKELKGKTAVLDGEIVCLDNSGRSRFKDLLFHRGQPRFYAFDLLWLEGVDTRSLPLHERKRKLRMVLPVTGERLLYCDHIEEHGEELFRLVCQEDLEGIVAKHRHGSYHGTEEKSPWFKIRNSRYSQMAGREELFSKPKQRPHDGWAGCTLSCVESSL